MNRPKVLIFHGHAKRHQHTSTYSTRCNMKRRCYDETNNWFYCYGAKGISVCDRWKYSFINFLFDMGEKPKGTSLDRINSEGDYTPENCCWATRIEQARARSGTLNYHGISLREACLIRGLNYKAAHWRLRHNLNPFIPIKRSKYNVK